MKQKQKLIISGLLATMFMLSSAALHASRRPPPPPPPKPKPPAAPAPTGNCFGADTYNIGRGMYDITGPAAEQGMMGYASLDQKTAGIHMRLYSRAFVFESPCNSKRVVFVSADIGQIFQSVKQGVVRKLRASHGNLYTAANVMISATHTHSGPGGYSHYALYNLTTLGYSKQTYDNIVNGIYQSIVRAHNNKRAGNIKINSGDLMNASFNRSATAYNNNPASERARYAHNTDKQMTLLRLRALNGQELGMVNWFAVHNTNIGNKNHLVSGDNKGYASYLFEKWRGTNYGSDTFIAAFAQANEGDVSPNLWGHPDTTNDYARNYTIGRRQYDKARALFNAASRNSVGEVDYRHMYVNFAFRGVNSRWTSGNGSKQTCRAAIGLSFAAGSTEDGVGVDFIPEGMVYDGANWPNITLVPRDQECHEKKIIFLTTGAMSPYPWTPEVLPVQIFRVGSIAMVAVPFECTTMCGRRIRETVKAQLGPRGVTDVVIAGLANAYAGYLTTKEEYDKQHYEGASNHFGPWALAAVQQEFHTLASAMRNGSSVGAGPTPRDLKDKQITLQTGVVFDDKPFWKSFGDVESNAKSSYNRGQTAQVTFWGGHPKNNLRTNGTYLEVQRNSGGWKTVYRDRDPQTEYHWKRSGIANSKVTIKWRIPSNAPKGQYRIRHYGHWKSGWNGNISSYAGTSRTFTVK